MNSMNALKYILVLTALVFSVSCTSLKELISPSSQDEEIPTAFVVRDPVDVRIYTSGEIHPIQMETIMAPPVSGGTLQIVYIVKTGSHVKKGDIVVQFDPSEQEYILEQSRSQLEEAEQKINKMKVDQAVRVAQEKVTLLNAESAVRRAELTIKGNALLSKIEARKNEIAFEEAKRKLEQLKLDIQSQANSDQASLATQVIALNKSKLDMKRAQENIDNMTIASPMDGVVVMGQNIQAILGGGVIISISSIPEYKEGDQAYAGEAIAQIQEIDQVEVHSKVLETDRGNLAQGQPVEVWLDSRPTKPFAGRIKSLSSSANSISNSVSTLEMLESLSSRSFDAVFEFDTEDEPLKLGVTAQIIIRGNDLENALSLPRQAIFQEDGRPVVYVKNGEDWQAHKVQIKYLTESRAILEGIEEGVEAALVNPDPDERGESSETNPLLSLRSGVD